MNTKISMLFLATIVTAMISAFNENESGKNAIVYIMTNDETGVDLYHKNNIHVETQNLAQDLNIPKIAEYFGCKTLIGKIFLEETLKHPVSPKDKSSVLMLRQNAIKILVDNPKLKREIEQLLEMAQQAELEVIELMSEFFKGQACPEISRLGLIKKQQPLLYPIHKFIYTNSKARFLATCLIWIQFGYYMSLNPYCTPKAWSTIEQLWGQRSMYAAGSLWALFISIYGYGAYKDYSTASLKRIKIHALNQLIVIAEKIEKLFVTYGIKNQFNISTVQDTGSTKLVKGLKHARYANKNTKLFLTSSVHTFLYKIYQEDRHFAEIFACIAEMDAYNALASKVLASENENNKFCFATFVESEKPLINTTGFWNILISNPVVNNICENKNIILTGPNKGGKTTSIRALLQNLVLGQSFGIAAAEYFECSMFDVIHSYLNISDDLINGLSLFTSELKRAQEILERIKSLKPQQRFFFALDELFTGTVSEDGETCAYEFIKRIIEFDDILFIYATHFDRLKKLGVNNQLCTNYKVDAPIMGKDKRLLYPFTLSQGASDSRVALDLAREANLFT